MPIPRAIYPQASVFGQRILKQQNDKMLVAAEIAIRFLGPGYSAFISDGSSTFYVGLEVFDRQIPLVINTNSIPIAHEYPLWESVHAVHGLEVHLSGGPVDWSLQMTSGDTTDDFVRNSAKIVDCCVLSARAIYSDQGPTGHEHHSMRVKHEVVGAAKVAVWAVDYTKLSRPWPPTCEPRVYDNSRWKEALLSGNTYIVTTRPPGVGGAAVTSMSQHPRTPDEWYVFHRQRLLAYLKDRFVEVVPVPAAVP